MVEKTKQRPVGDDRQLRQQLNVPLLSCVALKSFKHLAPSHSILPYSTGRQRNGAYERDAHTDRCIEHDSPPYLLTSQIKATLYNLHSSCTIVVAQQES